MLSLVPSVPATNFQPNYNIAPTHEVPVGYAAENILGGLGITAIIQP